MQPQTVEIGSTSFRVQMRGTQRHSLNTRLQKELTLARKIQQGILPPPCPQWDGLVSPCHNKDLNEEVSTFIGEAELQDDLTIVVLQIG